MKANSVGLSKSDKPQARLSNRKAATAKQARRTLLELGFEQFAKKVDFIHNHVAHPEAFVKDLLKSFRLVAGNGSIQPIFDCLTSWEATAELDASPHARKRILFMFTLYGKGWHLDRRRFDRMLAQQAEKRGVTFYTRASVVDY